MVGKGRERPGRGKNAVSLARALSKLGVASRTVAAGWIVSGRVAVNGRVVVAPERWVDLGNDRITVDGVPLVAAEKRYLALHKPPGYIVSRSDEQGRKTVYQCLGAEGAGLSPVGRLDKASQGLLLFTNDHRWADGLLSPEKHTEKRYHVQVAGHLSAEQVHALAEGVVLDGGERTLPARVVILRQGDKTQWLEFCLTEGKNRQIRRMLALYEFEVLRLIRVAIGVLELGALPKGAARPLTGLEVAALSSDVHAGAFKGA